MASKKSSRKPKASAAGNKSEQKRAAEEREDAGKAHTAHEGRGSFRADASRRAASTAASPPPT